MRSRVPKVLHPLLGRPLLRYGVEAALASGADPVIVVGGAALPQLQSALSDLPLVWAQQAEPLGTAHALMQVRPFLEGFRGTILVLPGDAPLLRPETLRQLAQARVGAGMALLSMELPDPRGYGRILRDDRGEVLGSVEEKDATPEQKALNEVNSGVYAFDEHVWRLLEEIDNANAAGEYYLPDLIAKYRQIGARIVALRGDPEELQGANSRDQLARLEAILLSRLRQQWMEWGVRMILPETIYLEPGVELASDVLLWPGVILRGTTRVEEGAEIGAYSILTDTRVGAGVRIQAHVVAEGAVLKAGSDAGPFAHLRPGAHLEEAAHVGNFVEVKNARLGRGAKAGHLAYLGDAEVGEESNIGAGVVTANYDGQRKHRTVIGPRAFIGSNSLLIAPLQIGQEAFIAGGSVIHQDVPEEALAIARERQRTIEGYRRRKRGTSKPQGSA
jgi:bifunctional UDP-N-acetylglucosamine pyrophosphorylase/glucosamine-1-phosphate N-acetyltransferase